MPLAYCVKCKEKTAQGGAQLIVSGKRARMSGKCEKCGGTTSVFVKSPGDAGTGAGDSGSGSA